VIVALHAATGAATGSLIQSRRGAIVLGPVLHVLSDRIPHRHPRNSVWEFVTGIIAVGAVANRRGFRDPATVGSLAAVLPDVEHIVPMLRHRRMKVFHARRRRQGTRRLSVRTQLLLAALILGPLLASGRPRQSTQPEHG